MKIALLFDNFGPYHCARLAAAARFGRAVGVEFSRKSAEYPWQRNDRHPCEIHSLDAPKSSGLFSKELHDILDSIGPDAVAIPGWFDKGAVIAARWCLDRRKPIVLMSESNRDDSKRNPLKEFLKKRFVNLCQAALVGGRGHKAYLCDLKFPADRIFLGYDVVDNAHFSGPAPPPSGQDPFFLASARFIEKKNLNRLIRAFHSYRLRQIEKSLKPWKLTLLGDGELREQIQTLICDLRLEDEVLLPGFVGYAGLPAYYSGAKAFIHASTVEQWGLVVNEAMAAGLPVIVSNRCGCSADLVRDGVNGYLVDPFDVSGMAQALGRVSSLPPQTLREMGNAGSHIISSWGPERFAEGIMSASRKALENGPPSDSALNRALLRLLLK